MINKGFLGLLFVITVLFTSIFYQFSYAFYPEVNAKNAIVIDSESGRILFYKNPFDKVPFASTTKIMTAIVALENAGYNEVFEVSNNASWVGGSTMGLKKGEKLPLYQLLYGLMMRSGNDAAITVAEGVGGSVEKFAVLMNQKAKDLGLNDTNFVSPHGLDSPTHLSSANDLANLAKYAMGNEIFRKIVRTKEMSVGSRHMVNTNPMLTLYDEVDGVKTGYTGLAGRCLVVSAMKANMKIIVVVLNCDTSKTRIADCKSLIDYTFEDFKKVKLTEENKIIAEVPISKGIEKTVKLIYKNSISMPLTQKEIETIKPEIDIMNGLKAPISRDTQVGKVTFRLSGELERIVPIYAMNDVSKRGIYDYFLEIFSLWTKELF